MILELFKISGHSMLPTLKPKGRILVSFLPYLFSKPKVRDVVIFGYGGKKMIKRISKIENEKYYLKGDNRNDSLKLKPIQKCDILGKIIFVL